MHRALIAVLPALALALAACPRVMPGEDTDGADVADESESGDEYGDSETGTETTGDTNQGCCQCIDGVESCWLSPEGDCADGETLLDWCLVVDGALSCGLYCTDPTTDSESDSETETDTGEVPPAACCTCPDSDMPAEFQCWEWTQSEVACEGALASTLNEPTHWCLLDGEGLPADCLDAC
jgi:hypothetical protein